MLASVNNEYDFKKIGNALRIQYPTCSGKPVFRKDYLGCSQSSAVGSHRPWKDAAEELWAETAQGKGPWLCTRRGRRCRGRGGLP